MQWRKSFDPRLYLIIDPCVMRLRNVEAVLEGAIEGGVTIVQVREKECSNAEFLDLARQTQTVLNKYGLPLIVNDRVDVAQNIGAAGVHVGQSDLHWSEARKMLGPQAIIGLSIETMAQANAVQKEDLDYFGVSSVFPTATKKDVKSIWGLRGLRALRKECRHKLVGIGGITSSNANEVMMAGADGVAVISAICSSLSPKQEAMKFRGIIDSSLEEKILRNEEMEEFAFEI